MADTSNIRFSTFLAEPIRHICCCLPCNHCSNWTWIVEEILAFLVSGCVLLTAGSSFNVNTVIALDLNKCHKQVKYPRSLLTCASISDLPSYIRTMVFCVDNNSFHLQYVKEDAKVGNKKLKIFKIECFF